MLLNSRSIRLIAAMFAGAMALRPIYAQTVGPLPGQDRPLPSIPNTPGLDFTIQAPRRSPVPRAVEDLTFDVRDVKIVGNTLYSDDLLKADSQNVIGKTVHLADLIAVADAIEARYHKDGFVLTRAFVPTQNVANGVFQISVVEGYVSAIAVQGDDSASRERVEQLLAPITQFRPLPLAKLEAALLTANQLPGVAAAGLLRPSPTETGASELVVTVTETPLGGSLSSDNSGGANTGRWTLAADSSFHSPLGDGGILNLNASVNPVDVQQRNSVSGRYTAPLPLLDGMTYTLSALASHGQPGGTVAFLKLITDSVALGSRISVPLVSSRADKVALDVGLTVQSANVRARGEPLNHDQWRVVDSALTYQNTDWADGTSNVTLDIAKGIPALGATPDGSARLSQVGAHTDFTKNTLLLRRLQTIGGGFSALVTATGQYSRDTLVTGEEVSFGGTQFGRGYDPGSITGDLGAGGASELRYDLDSDALSLDLAQIYGFFDAGKVWLHHGSITHNKIESAGGGVRLGAFGAATLGVEAGTALIAVPGNEKGRHATRVVVNSSVRF